MGTTQIAELERYQLAYLRMHNGSGSWRRTLFRSRFEETGLAAAYKHASQEWRACEKRWKHLSITFDSLVVVIPWWPSRDSLIPKDTRAQLHDRCFIIRYTLQKPGLQGAVFFKREERFQAETFRHACMHALDSWQGLRDKVGEGEGIEWTGFYEALPWKPE